MVDSRAGPLAPATPASEQPLVPQAQQQEQSKEVFCPMPGKKARQPTNSSDCRCLGGNSLWGRGLLELSLFQNQRQGCLEETQTCPVFTTEAGRTIHTDCRSEGHSDSGFCWLSKYRRNTRGDVGIHLLWSWDA